MLSVNELEYLKSLINRYQKEGYKYYVCTTVSESNIVPDLYLFLSKDKIEFVDNKTFTIKNGIRLSIDTNYSYNTRPNVLSLDLLNVNDIYVLSSYEFIYSNCSYAYELTQNVIYPDLLLSDSNSYLDLNVSFLSCFLILSILLYLFVKSIFRIRR